MSRSQTSTSLRSTNFHTGGMSSGLAIHEREREEERRRRAKLSKQASNSGEHPLFPEPKKVQPSVEDALQQKIQATLGKFDTIGSSLLQHGSHLLGIQRLPQTPVEGDQKFNFDPKFKDSKNSSELKKAKAAFSSYQASLKTVTKIPKEEVKTVKNQKVNGVLNGTGHTISKSPLVIKTQDANASSKTSTLSHLKSPTPKETTPSKSAETKKAISHLKSPTVKETTPAKSVEMKKAEIKPVANGAFKSRQSDSKEKEKGKGSVKVKGPKEGKGHGERENSESCKEQTNRSNSNNKSKPPKIKLSMPERNLPLSSVQQENLAVNEPTNVEKIIAEMQQVAPPLTGIHTPIKGGNSIFAFHKNSVQDNCVLPVFPIKRKPSETTESKKDIGNGVVLLDDDLMLTDESDDEHDHQVTSPLKTTKDTRHRSHSTSSSGSSSEDSDSDSSDSDSDSSASDSNNNTKDKPVKSPVHVPSSPPKAPSGRNWGLDHFVNALNQSSTSPTTKTKPSPSAANTVGEDGVRGNQVAPAANGNKSSLNSHVSNHVTTVNEKKSPAPMAVEESLTPFAAGLLSHSPELDHGVDIESLTAKLEFPVETNSNTDSTKPVSNDELAQNESSVKIQPPKDNKKGKRRASTAGSKLNSGQEKSQSGNSPKKLLKSKMETNSLKNSTIVKLNNSSADENANKASKTTKSADGTIGKKSTKKKAETKSSGIIVTSNETVKPASEVDDEDVIVDIVGVETSPGQDIPKSNSKPTPKSKETERSKGMKTKPALTNGLSKHVNGDKLLSSLISPNRTKDILGKNVEITYDEVNKPESLIVKIDLSLLKRIPKLPGNEQTKHSDLSPSADTNGSRDMISSPEVKIPKRKLSDVRPVEHETPKKGKNENDADSIREKSRERSFSSSSTNSRHSKEGHRKRSPSQEKDSYRIKRQRHDSENNKVHDSSLEGLPNGRLNENGLDTVDNGLKPHRCTCNKNNENGKRETDISRFYDQEPRVPYGPDHYLTEAKKLKHKADSSTDKEAKAFLYVDAVLHFARCGKAIEQTEESELRSAKMYSETLDLLRYTMRNFVNKYTHRSDRVPDKRLSALCMRIQSILYMRLYKLRKDSIMRNVKMVTEHFRGPPKSTQAPSPYTSNTKITGTPSPLSPTPSPSGSVGSVGSNGSNETMTTPSRNSKPSSGSNAMTSPVNVCIPQKIHAMTQQHVLLVNNLVYSQDMWDQAQPVVLEFRDFFMDLDRKCGPLTLHSSIVHLFEYIEEGMKRIQDSLKAEKSS